MPLDNALKIWQAAPHTQYNSRNFSQPVDKEMQKIKRRESDAKCRANLSLSFEQLRKQVLDDIPTTSRVSRVCRKHSFHNTTADLTLSHLNSNWVKSFGIFLSQVESQVSRITVLLDKSNWMKRCLTSYFNYKFDDIKWGGEGRGEEVWKKFHWWKKKNPKIENKCKGKFSDSFEA